MCWWYATNELWYLSIGGDKHEHSRISRQAISKWESGQGNPEIDNVIKLTEIYDVSADYILLGKESSTIVTTSEKKRLSKEARKTIGIISIIAAMATITVLFIIALGLMAKYVL